MSERFSFIMSTRKRLNAEQEQQIITLYIQGHSFETCASILNVSSNTISFVLKRNNIPSRPAKRVSEERLTMIRDLYLGGKSSTEIGGIIGIAPSGVLRLLRKQEVKTRTNGETHKKLTVTPDYFENINTSDKAYFLGLLVSDGYACKNSIQINLQEGDKEILETFSKYIGYNGTIAIAEDNRKESYKNMARLTIYCQQLTNDLIQYGVTKGKSYNAFYPNIPKEFDSHFIRGVFDGDGWVTFTEKSRCVGFVGTLSLITSIKNILIEQEITDGKIKTETLDNNITCKFTLSKKDTLLRLREFLYKGCNDLFIDRKFTKFQHMI